MRTLLLLRHAKSSWDDPALDDFERPLAPRGREAAPLMASFIASHDLRPDYVVCSSAVRTQATLGLVLPAFAGKPPAVIYDDTLYLASRSALMTRLRRVPAKWRRVMVVGHNPGLHDLALHVVARSDDQLHVALAAKFATAALAVVAFNVATWHDVTAHSGELTHFTTPSRLQKALARQQ